MRWDRLNVVIPGLALLALVDLMAYRGGWI